MNRLRTILHGSLYFVHLVLCCVGLLPALALPPKLLRRVLLACYFGQQDNIDRLFGLRCNVTGRENLPPPPCLIALQHQSGWETLRLLSLFRDPAIIMKIELMRMPLWGWYASRADMIPIDRSLGSKAVPAMVEHAATTAAQGRDITIFPQGTRTPPGTRRPFKPGIAILYDRLQLPVVPVALNSGVYTNKLGLLKKPGTIEVHILPPIMPGMEGEVMLKQLQEVIEAESDKILADCGFEPGQTQAGASASTR